MSQPPSRAPQYGGGLVTHGGETVSDEGAQPDLVGAAVVLDPADTGNSGGRLATRDAVRLERRCDALDVNYAQFRRDQHQDRWMLAGLAVIVGGLACVVALLVGLQGGSWLAGP